MADLVLALERYSPLRIIKQTGKGGENTVPSREDSGGDGGGLDSISPKYSEPIRTEESTRNNTQTEIILTTNLK